MSKRSINLEQYDGNGFMKDGWRNAVIDKAEFTTSQSGNEMLKVSFQTDKPKIIIPDYFVQGHKVSMERLKSLLIACAHPNPNYLSDPDELYGLKCQIKIVTVEGRCKVKGYRAAEGDPNDPMADVPEMRF